MSSIVSKVAALITADDLPQRIESALRGGHRGTTRQQQMSPELSYGRHAGPALTPRAAAVMLLLFRRAGRWHLPLTERPATLARHAGQISLPGGSLESGESSLDAAARELNEELGFDAPLSVLGRLADCYVFASDFLVTPWVAATREPDIIWRPHDREVQGVVELPLDLLLDDASTRPTDDRARPARVPRTVHPRGSGARLGRHVHHPQ